MGILQKFFDASAGVANKCDAAYQAELEKLDKSFDNWASNYNGQPLTLNLGKRDRAEFAATAFARVCEKTAKLSAKKGKPLDTSKLRFKAE